ETVRVRPAPDQHGPDESLLRAEEVEQHTRARTDRGSERAKRHPGQAVLGGIGEEFPHQLALACRVLAGGIRCGLALRHPPSVSTTMPESSLRRIHVGEPDPPAPTPFVRRLGEPY